MNQTPPPRLRKPSAHVARDVGMNALPPKNPPTWPKKKKSPAARRWWAGQLSSSVHQLIEERARSLRRSRAPSILRPGGPPHADAACAHRRTASRADDVGEAVAAEIS